MIPAPISTLFNVSKLFKKHGSYIKALSDLTSRVYIRQPGKQAIDIYITLCYFSPICFTPLKKHRPYFGALSDLAAFSYWLFSQKLIDLQFFKDVHRKVSKVSNTQINSRPIVDTEIFINFLISHVFTCIQFIIFKVAHHDRLIFAKYE